MPQKNTTYVIKNNMRVPFLKGMLTHWLIVRGFNFEIAYSVANKIKNNLKGIKEIASHDLLNMVLKEVESLLPETNAGKYKQPFTSSPIIVQGKSANIPFSKGILSQSLQASGMEPKEAFQLAQSIEQLLRLQKIKSISRNKLRSITYQKILIECDQHMADRYLLWRLLQNSAKPIIILIGGATGVGKSTIASEIAHRMGILKVVGTDVIRQIMRGLFSDNLISSLHASSYEAWKTINFPLDRNVDPVIEGFKMQAINVCTGIDGVIQRIIIENENAIIEGVHLVPGFIDLSKYARKAHIVHIVVSSFDPETLKNRFQYRYKGTPSRKISKYLKNFQNIFKIQTFIIEQAENKSVPIIENVILDSTVSDVLELISNILSNARDFKENLKKLKEYEKQEKQM